MANVKEKETVWEEASEKRVTHKGTAVRLSADFFSAALQARNGRASLVSKERNLQRRVIYPVKLLFGIEGQMESFRDKQKLKDFVNIKPFFQATLKGPL